MSAAKAKEIKDHVFTTMNSVLPSTVDVLYIESESTSPHAAFLDNEVIYFTERLALTGQAKILQLVVQLTIKVVVSMDFSADDSEYTASRYADTLENALVLDPSQTTSLFKVPKTTAAFIVDGSIDTDLNKDYMTTEIEFDILWKGRL